MACIISKYQSFKGIIRYNEVHLINNDKYFNNINLKSKNIMETLH
jgi:hypothetical protein